MSKFITSASEIPNAEFYVLAKDTFLSGWGLSKGKANIVILPASSYEEAEIIVENMGKRSDMSYVRINTRKPRLQPHNTYSLFSREDAERWYTKGGFSGLNGLGADMNVNECGALGKAVAMAKKNKDPKLASVLKGISRKHTCKV